MIDRLKRAKRAQDKTAQQQTEDGRGNNDLPRDVANLISVILPAEVDRDQKREERKARHAKNLAAAQARLAMVRGNAKPPPLTAVLHARRAAVDAGATTGPVSGNCASGATGLADRTFSPESVGDRGRHPGSHTTAYRPNIKLKLGCRCVALPPSRQGVASRRTLCGPAPLHRKGTSLDRRAEPRRRNSRMSLAGSAPSQEQPSFLTKHRRTVPSRFVHGS